MRAANALYEGHRLILPGMREKAKYTCGDCRFCAYIQGREDKKCGCLAGVKIFLVGDKRIPATISARDFMYLAGREALLKAVANMDPERQACGLFRMRDRTLNTI